jgi:hypothetical protein
MMGSSRKTRPEPLRVGVRVKDRLRRNILQGFGGVLHALHAKFVVTLLAVT